MTRLKTSARFFNAVDLHCCLGDLGFWSEKPLASSETFRHSCELNWPFGHNEHFDVPQGFVVQSTQVGIPYPSALAVPDSLEFTETTTSSPALVELEGLIERELDNDAPGASWPGLPISEEQLAYEDELLRQCELSQAMASWVEKYECVGDRHPYLWTWCYHGAELTTLPCVSASWYEEVCDTKFLGIMLDVLVDDVADQGGDAELLERMVCLPLSDRRSDWQGFTEQEQKYAAFTEEVWNEIQRRVERFPRFEEFADLLRYDYLQLLNMMRYAHLMNRFPSLLNLAEHDLYLPHNMHMIISATMDLMCSPEFDFDELGRVRQAMWHAQCMGRIGDMITTWERELYQDDFTSGVFARALVCGDLSREQLASADRESIEQAIRDGLHEEYFLQRWQQHRDELVNLQASVSSVDLEEVVHRLERLICLHLVSRGYK